jgi:hypothetical protein
MMKKREKKKEERRKATTFSPSFPTLSQSVSQSVSRQLGWSGQQTVEWARSSLTSSSCLSRLGAAVDPAGEKVALARFLK